MASGQNRTGSALARATHRFGWLLVWFALAISTPPAAHAEAAPRSALVVGNASYAFSPLLNPINDARAMAGTLGDMGFEVVLLENATQGDLEHALGTMKEDLAHGGLGLFYFAGHAVQYRGINFLLPVDLDLDAARADLPASSLDISTVLEAMSSAGFGINVVILDACRDYPFGEKIQAIGEGLANVTTAGETLVAYATAAGQVALDGTGPNSPYTSALVSTLELPGTDLYDVFRIVRGKVREATSGRQLPWISGSIESQIVLREDDVVPAGLQLAGVSPDEVHWNTIRSSVDPGDFDRFISVHPRSPHVAQARQRRLKLEAEGRKRIAPLMVTAEPLAAPGDQPLEVTPCDVWTSDPDDLRRITTGVEWGLVNTRAAIRDCAAAVAEDPDNPRLNYNFARALDVAERFTEAESFYRRAAAQNYAAAFKGLGYMHRTGRGRPQNYEQAAEYYYLGALNGLPWAKNALGKLYAVGWGVPKSSGQSLHWVEMAAVDGYDPAIDHLGNIYREGNGVEADPGTAFRYYQAAAALGNTNAMANLARIYLEGSGTAADPQAALSWYQRAVEEGNPYAPYHLGRLYRTGEVLVDRDPRRALALLELAADRGNEWALWQIAEMHAQGDLGAPNPARAYYYFRLARAAGEQRRNPGTAELAALASEKLEELAAELNAATVAALEAEAETWLAQNTVHQFTLISPY